MNNLTNRYYYSFLFVFYLSILAYSQNTELPKPKVESGAITIKVLEGIGPLDKQSGSVSFGISSLDQLVVNYEATSLSNRFQHKSIPVNSGLPDLSRIYRIEFPKKYNVVRVANEFSKNPNIEYAEPIPINYLSHEPNDPLYSQQWVLPKIQAPEAWNIHRGEDGDSTIIIAITDSGVDWDHPDLVDNIWNNLGEDADADGHTLEWNGTSWTFDPGDINGIDDDLNGYTDDFIGWDIGGNNNNPNDLNGHGTGVSGLAGSITNNLIGISSISYNLKVMPVKGSRYNSTIYAAENGADVINCSWGSYFFSVANMEVIEYVTGLGSVVVAAAGNNRTDALNYPASYPKVISVAGTDPQDILVFYTNYGPSIDVSAPAPDLASNTILTTFIGGGYGQVGLGTSFSAPIVTGLLGLIKSYHPTWSRDQLVTQLLGTTDNIDLLNPGKDYLLGTGRINAYHALVDSNVSVPQELKLHSSLLPIISSNFMPNEIVDIGLRVHNFSHDVSANNLTITLTTNDPDIQILDGEYIGSLPADGLVDLADEFQIQIASNATTHSAVITFHFSAEVPIVVGEDQDYSLFINPKGVFVWEGVENGQDYSGAYIRDYLNSQGYATTYSTDFPSTSLIGLDAVFLSFGNFFSSTFFDTYMAASIEEYLETGGNVYLEGGLTLGWDQFLNSNLKSLFGLSSVTFGLDVPNPINLLVGHSDALTQGMLFTSSNQVSNVGIDKYVVNSMGRVSLSESGYGDVAAEGTGTFGQRTFCFSYSLAELVDENPPSTRDTLIQRILDFFGVDSVVTVVEKDKIPIDYTLMQNYPNPFNPVTIISYSLPAKSQVELVIYNTLGEEVKQLVNGEKEAGSYSVKLNAIGLPSGVYFYRIQAGSFVETKKMILMK